MDENGQALVEYALLAAALFISCCWLARALQLEIPARFRTLLNLTAFYFPW